MSLLKCLRFFDQQELCLIVWFLQFKRLLDPGAYERREDSS